MRPGITIQHGTLPVRPRGLVRSDVGVLLSFVPADRRPAGATASDFVEFRLRRWQELAEHPDRDLVDGPTRRAARLFFENGGDELLVLSVCVDDEADLRGPGCGETVLQPVLARLRGEDDLGLLAVPATAYWRCEVRRNGRVLAEAEALWDTLLAHCREVNHRFLVLDAPRGLHGDLLERWFLEYRARDPLLRPFGAMYYPWLRRGDDHLPPSGAVMGMIARVELEHAPLGIAWPPANAEVRGVTHCEVELDWGEAGRWSEIGINPLLVQAGRGVVAWGARTLSEDPKWCFINSRRIVSMITEQLRRDNEWAVFEPNDRSLWRVIERDALVRLDQFWAAGLLAGPRAQAEYSVDCSDATNPAEARESGQLNVRIDLVPVGTTERILVDLRLGHGSG